MWHSMLAADFFPRDSLRLSVIFSLRPHATAAVTPPPPPHPSADRTLHNSLPRQSLATPPARRQHSTKTFQAIAPHAPSLSTHLASSVKIGSPSPHRILRTKSL